MHADYVQTFLFFTLLEYKSKLEMYITRLETTAAVGYTTK